jgi:hypothetical protein
MKIHDSVTGKEHLDIRVGKKFVHIEPVGTDEWDITEDLRKLVAEHEQITLKDLFQYFGFITSVIHEDAFEILEELNNAIKNKEEEK